MKTTNETTIHPASIIAGHVAGTTTAPVNPQFVPFTNGDVVDFVVGDVVVVQSDGTVILANVAADTRPVGIAGDAIAAGAVGPIQFTGPVDLINVTTSVTAGNFAQTSSTPGHADPTVLRGGASFGYFTASGTNPSGFLFGGGGAGSIGGGRPPFDYVVAASDSAPEMQAIADAVCDGTADEAEINVAIAAAVTAGRPYSILLLPGIYHCAAAVDFRGLTASGGQWLTFEASGATIQASASMTTLVRLDPSAGGQILTCADLRFGALDGNVGTYTVGQLVNMARFNDNILRIADIRNGSGNGIKVSQSGVSDYPCGNNKIDIEIIHNMGGSAFQATGGTNALGFQGNTVHLGETIACANGIILGGSANQNATYNTFICGPIESITGAGIYDYCGGNTFIVNNLNSNGKHLGGPAGMTLKSTYIVTIDHATAGTVDAAVTDQHYVLDGGTLDGINEYLARASVPATPASGYGRLWAKTDGTLHYVNSAGTDIQVGSGVTFAIPSITYGTPAAGAAATAVRSDATIAKPTAPDVDFSADVTNNNVSTSAHGLAPKLPNDATKYLDGTGAYSVPPGSGSNSGIAVPVWNVTFNGDGSTTVFELPAAPFDAYSVGVFVGTGRNNDWTLSNAMLTTLTFGSAPTSGTANISVDIMAAAA